MAKFGKELESKNCEIEVLKEMVKSNQLQIKSREREFQRMK